MKMLRSIAGTAGNIFEHVLAISCVTTLELAGHLYLDRFGSDFRTWPALVYLMLAVAIYAAGSITTHWLLRRRVSAQPSVPATLASEGSELRGSPRPALLAFAAAAAALGAVAWSLGRARLQEEVDAQPQP